MNENIENMSFQATAGSRRLAYQSPRLSVLGDVGSLTETGSVNGTEGYFGGIYMGMAYCLIETNPQNSMC